MDSMHRKITGYAPVNGLRMYYEIEGAGDPLVYIPPALGVTGACALPALAGEHAVITLDLQGHGRTADIPERPMTLQQNARDVAGLLKHLGISRADIFGESYGGATAVLIALHHPELTGRVATYGSTFGPLAAALNPEMIHFSSAPTAESGSFRFQRRAYEAVAADPDYWPRLWQKASSVQWHGFTDAELAAIKTPILVAVGDRDFVRVEHAVESFRRIPGAQLAVIPDAGHFLMYSEPERLTPVLESFLRRREKAIPVATAEMGYQPGESR